MSLEEQWNLALWEPGDQQQILDLWCDMESGVPKEVTELLSQSIEKLEIKWILIVWDTTKYKFHSRSTLVSDWEVLKTSSFEDLDIKTVINWTHSFTFACEKIFLSHLYKELKFWYYDKFMLHVNDIVLSVYWDDLYYVSFTYEIDWVQKTWNALVSNSREKIEWFLKK